jgi:hypothetical protein
VFLPKKSVTHEQINISYRGKNNVRKTKELIVDYRKRADHAPTHNSRAVVEQVKSVHITKKLS